MPIEYPRYSYNTIYDSLNDEDCMYLVLKTLRDLEQDLTVDLHDLPLNDTTATAEFTPENPLPDNMSVSIESLLHDYMVHTIDHRIRHLFQLERDVMVVIYSLDALPPHKLRAKLQRPNVTRWRILDHDRESSMRKKRDYIQQVVGNPKHPIEWYFFFVSPQNTLCSRSIQRPMLVAALK